MRDEPERIALEDHPAGEFLTERRGDETAARGGEPAEDVVHGRSDVGFQDRRKGNPAAPPRS
ncbi:hypothetical protein ACFQ60_43390 [Streptomyces zhihengii]